MVSDQNRIFASYLESICLRYGEKTMFIRKFVLSLMLIALTVGVGVAVAQDAPKELRFGTLQGTFIDGVNAMMISEFNKLHPDIPVKLEVLDGATLDVTLAAQAAAGSLADVIFTADLYVVPFAKGGISVDMEPLAKADPNFDLS